MKGAGPALLSWGLKYKPILTGGDVPAMLVQFIIQLARAPTGIAKRDKSA